MNEKKSVRIFKHIYKNILDNFYNFITKIMIFRIRSLCNYLTSFPRKNSVQSIRILIANKGIHSLVRINLKTYFLRQKLISIILFFYTIHFSVTFFTKSWYYYIYTFYCKAAELQINHTATLIHWRFL